MIHRFRSIIVGGLRGHESRWVSGDSFVTLHTCLLSGGNDTFDTIVQGRSDESKDQA